MKFARDGIPSIFGTILITGLFFFIHPIPAAVMGLLTGLTLWFYRDPDREIPQGEGLFVSPADGKVVEIEPAEHPFTGAAMKIGIFMSPLSVHVNRAPCDGEVAYLEYIPGKKIAAFAPKASEVNERFLTGLNTAYGPVLMVQIAGFLARRIVCRLRRGDRLARGERYGMIKLGSKVDVYLPTQTDVLVKIGDKVAAGKSILGGMNQ